MTFTIPYPKTKAGMKQFCKRLGMNALYSGKPWQVRQEDAKYIHQTVRAALMEQRIPRTPFQKPVGVTFYWNDRLDLDNHSYAGKLILDGLKGWVIQDDDRRFIRVVEHRFYDKNYITVEVNPV